MACSESCKNFVKVSLLLESVGLTMDKVMRCAAGIHEAEGNSKKSSIQRITLYCHSMILHILEVSSIHCLWWFSGSVQIRRHTCHTAGTQREGPMLWGWRDIEGHATAWVWSQVVLNLLPAEINSLSQEGMPASISGTNKLSAMAKHLV